MDTLERLVRRLVSQEASDDAIATDGAEERWGDLVLRIIDATDADRERVLSAIADFIISDEGGE